MNLLGNAGQFRNLPFLGGRSAMCLIGSVRQLLDGILSNAVHRVLRRYTRYCQTSSAYTSHCKLLAPDISIAITWHTTTLVSSNMLVQSKANYCVMFGRYSSFIGTNALVCCDRYNWSLSELISNPEHI